MEKFSLWQSQSVRTALNIAVVGGLVFACNNEAPTPDANPSSARIGVTQVDNEGQLDLVAKTLAKTLADPQIRSLIKTEAAKKFDGDYDILYANVAVREIRGKTVNQIMNATLPVQTNARSAAFDEVAKSMPLLNISVPIHLEKWETENYEPLVAISPSSFVKDEKKLDKVKAYDSNGKIHYLDAKKAPDFPVVVVGLNERTDIGANGVAVLKRRFIKPSETKDHMANIADPGDGSGGGGTSPSGGGSSGCSFNDGQYEYVDYIYCENGNAWEGWFDGGPEFYLTIGGYDISFINSSMRAKVLDGGNRVPFYGSNYHDFEALPQGKDFNHTPMIRWFTDYGEILTYIWREEDTGGIVDQTEDITVKWAGQVYSTNLITQLRSNDDFVVKLPVYRQDCSPFYYGSTTFRWKVTRN